MWDRGVHRRDLGRRISLPWGTPDAEQNLGVKGRGKDEIPSWQHGVPGEMWAADEMVGAVSPWMEMEGKWLRTEGE